MTLPITRRRFLGRAAAGSLVPTLIRPLKMLGAEAPTSSGPELRWTDFHVHLDNSTIDKALELSRERGVKFGIVEHAGTKENKYPRVLSTDAELRDYLATLEGKPVFKGVQAEWIDWMGCFSAEALGQLDYVLTDAMTFPGKDGRRAKLWEADAAQRVDMEDKEAFMDRYVDWHVEVMAKEPFDIPANTTWLPAGLDTQWETYWTPARCQKVIDASLKYGIALEISSSYKLPKLPFLKLAKAAGAKFSFGSNGRYPNMGKLEYCLLMAKELDLKPSDMFTPAPNGQKAVQRRK
jgi:histidinol phosphatase-like PHP family hydrolase